MKKKKESTGFLNNWIVRNVLLALVAVLALVCLINVLLAIITQHNKEIKVPDFTNLSYSEAYAAASSAGLTVVVKDSLYVRRLRPGVVIEQNPKAGAMVKHGRKVSLTTCTYNAEKVPMPSLVGFSLLQAKAELHRNGLVLGKLIYVEDIATNNVLRQQYRGRDIKAGTMITNGSTVNLVLGLNPEEDKTIVPELEGKDYLKALDMIQENSLNAGRVRFDSSVKTYADSVSAVVYFQDPGRDSEPVVMGTEISISLRPVK